MFFILEKSCSSLGISVSSHEKYVFGGEVKRMLKPLPLLFSCFLQTLPCNCAEVVIHLIQDFVHLTEISLVFHHAFSTLISRMSIVAVETCTLSVKPGEPANLFAKI